MSGSRPKGSHFLWMVTERQSLLRNLKRWKRELGRAETADVLEICAKHEMAVAESILALKLVREVYCQHQVPVARSYLNQDGWPTVSPKTWQRMLEQDDLGRYSRSDEPRILLVTYAKPTSRQVMDTIRLPSSFEHEADRDNLPVVTAEPMIAQIPPLSENSDHRHAHEDVIDPDDILDVLVAWIEHVTVFPVPFGLPIEYAPHGLAQQLRELRDDGQMLMNDLANFEQELEFIPPNMLDKRVYKDYRGVWQPRAARIRGWHSRLIHDTHEILDRITRAAKDLVVVRPKDCADLLTLARGAVLEVERRIKQRLALSSYMASDDPQDACGYHPVEFKASPLNDFLEWWRPVAEQLLHAADRLEATPQLPKVDPADNPKLYYPDKETCEAKGIKEGPWSEQRTLPAIARACGVPDHEIRRDKRLIRTRSSPNTIYWYWHLTRLFECYKSARNADLTDPKKISRKK